MKEKVVLAYSGGLDTTAVIPWLKETFGYDVICCCINCGQGEELDGLEERAKMAGASKLYIEDIIDDTEQMTGGQCAVIQAVAEVFREGRHCPRDGQIADDRIEWRADLMAHAGQEVPLGLAGLPGRVQGIDECLLCFIDIAPEKDETAERMRSGGRDALQGVRIPAPAGGTPDAALQIDLAAFPAQAGK